MNIKEQVKIRKKKLILLTYYAPRDKKRVFFLLHTHTHTNTHTHKMFIKLTDNKVFYCTMLGSVVCIATGYGLDGPESNPGGGARFYAPVQTGPGAHPASCTMGTGSCPGVKSSRGVTLTPHPLLVPSVMKE
jgi:hypothetical protein